MKQAIQIESNQKLPFPSRRLLRLTRNFMTKGYCYILTNKNKTVLYIGATNDLRRRTSEHKNGKYSNSFTKRYNCNLLVYFEEFDTIKDAFVREKQLKSGNRKRKEDLITSINPDWKDLSLEWKAD